MFEKQVFNISKFYLICKKCVTNNKKGNKSESVLLTEKKVKNALRQKYDQQILYIKYYIRNIRTKYTCVLLFQRKSNHQLNVAKSLNISERKKINKYSS